MAEETKQTPEEQNGEAKNTEQTEEKVDDVQEETKNDDCKKDANEEKRVEEKSEEQLKIEQLEKEKEELHNRLLRVYADYDNFRRRTREEKERDAKYRAQSLVEDILPVLDNFERALTVQTTNEESKSILQGMEMVYRQLLEALKKEGVSVIEAVGKPFDPNYHEAVMQVNEEGYESNIVVEELQKGYMLKDRVIRPSMVKVNS